VDTGHYGHSELNALAFHFVTRVSVSLLNPLSSFPNPALLTCGILFSVTPEEEKAQKGMVSKFLTDAPNFKRPGYAPGDWEGYVGGWVQAKC
jgi:hypothetical protein